jgi:hypothetical protein
MIAISERVKVMSFWRGLHVRHAEGDRLWATQGYQVLRSDDQGRTWQGVARVGRHATASQFGPLGRLLRSGIRSYLQTGEDRFLFTNRAGYYWRQHSPPRLVYRGCAPLFQGCCAAPDGTVYFGEYSRNPTRRAVVLWRWAAGSDRWSVFYRFPPGTVRHIHAVHYDPFARTIWVATGDADPECLIGYFNGQELVPIVQGSQQARAVSLLFTSDYAFWGSDSGRDANAGPNRIYRWRRSRQALAASSLEPVAEVGGPAYYSTTDGQGRLFISTAVEGSNSETDNCARVWMSETGADWIEIARWEKDRYPMIFGYGVMSFPAGIANDCLLVTGKGVKGGPGTWQLKIL